MDDLAKGLEEVRRGWLEWRKQFISAAVTALGVVVALAWNEAMKSAFERLFSPSDTALAKFGYALLMTSLLVFAMRYVAKRASVRAKESEKEKEKESETPKKDCG